MHSALTFTQSKGGLLRTAGMHAGRAVSGFRQFAMLLRLLLIPVYLLVSASVSAELIKNQTLLIEGIDRTYDIYTPSLSSSESRPLVLLLHGHGGDADVMTGENNRPAPYKVWLSIAEREGWYVVIPDGEYGSDDKRGWNDCRADTQTNPTTDDVRFLTTLVDTASSSYPINQQRVYAHGTSNGGMMALRLAQESGDKFKAVAAVVAQMQAESECEAPNHPVSVLFMNGTRDPILPFNGGAIGRREGGRNERGTVVSTDESVKYWLVHNKITSLRSRTKLPNIGKLDRSRVQVDQFTGGAENTEVILYKIIRGGHTEPSLTERYRPLYKAIVGRQNADIEMAEKVWKFFEQHK